MGIADDDTVLGVKDADGCAWIDYIFLDDLGVCFPKLNRGHVPQRRIHPEVVVPMHVVGQLDLQLTRRVERLAVAQARYDELKQISAKDGSTLMSNSTFEYVAENATEGQFAFFKDVLDNEFELRRASRIARLKRGADFPFQKSFDGFEWDGIGFPSGFTREDMLSLGFVDRHEDLVLFGGSGNGKSHTAVALGILVCGMGKRAKFSSTSRLVNELNEANAEGRIAAMLKGLARNDMIILDEWGYLPTDPDGARLLFRVVSMCYERISLILTTNIEFSRWGEIFNDDDMAKAMMDRIVHHGRLVTYERESYRMKHALMRNDY